MSNLGTYQLITTASKAVGGPDNLVALIAASGYVVGKGIEALIKKMVPHAKQKIGIAYKEPTVTYTVVNEVTDEQGLTLHLDDEIRIMEVDDDAIQIEVIGDNNNPYFISLETLKYALGDDIEL